MATHELTASNFESTIAGNDIVLIDFWADWCGPCKSFGPVFERVAGKNPDIHFAKCDTEKEQDLAAHFGIRSIPTLAIFRDQVLLFLEAGAIPENALEEVIGQVRALDMAEVHAKIAEHEQSHREGGCGGGGGGCGCGGGGGKSC